MPDFVMSQEPNITEHSYMLIVTIIAQLEVFLDT